MKLKKLEIPFTQVANNILVDKNITWKAKGLFSYLASKPDGWDFASKRIAEETKDGLKSTSSWLQELETNGYLKRTKLPNGRMVYMLSYEKMATDTPKPQKGKQPKGQSAKTGALSNNDIISNKDINKDIINNTETSVSESENNEIDIIKDKRDPEVQDIIDTITAVHGIIDGTQKENRQYAYLLSKKIKKLNWFSEKFWTVGEFIQKVIENTDEFRIWKTTSPKKLYYNLSELLANIRAQKNKQIKPKTNISYG